MMERIIARFFSPALKQLKLYFIRYQAQTRGFIKKNERDLELYHRFIQKNDDRAPKLRGSGHTTGGRALARALTGGLYPSLLFAGSSPAQHRFYQDFVITAKFSLQKITNYMARGHLNKKERSNRGDTPEPPLQKNYVIKRKITLSRERARARVNKLRVIIFASLRSYRGAQTHDRRARVRA